MTLKQRPWTRQDVTCSMIALSVLFSLYYLQESDSQLFEFIYFPFSTFIEQMEGFCFPLFTSYLQVHYTDLIGSLLVCQSYRLKTKQKHWSESLFVCCVGQYGGTTLTALLLGQPPGWMLSHSSFLSLVVAWWLTFCCPFDLFWIFFSPPSSTTGPFSSFLHQFINLHHSFFLSISSVHAATSWGMDKVLYPSFHSSPHLIQNSLFLALLTTVLSSNGGGLLCDLLSLFQQQSFQLRTPTCMQATAQGDRVRANLLRSLFLGVVYSLILNPFHIFTWPSLTQEQRVYGHSVIGCLCLLMWIRDQLAPEVDLIGRIWSLGEDLVCLRLLSEPERRRAKIVKKTN
jgi:uncharacterized membrane protein YeiH